MSEPKGFYGGTENVYTRVNTVGYMALDVEQLQEMRHLPTLGADGWVVIYAYPFISTETGGEDHAIISSVNMTRFILMRRGDGR